jgi:hypothetical protein
MIMKKYFLYIICYHISFICNLLLSLELFGFYISLVVPRMEPRASTLPLRHNPSPVFCILTQSYTGSPQSIRDIPQLCFFFLENPCISFFCYVLHSYHSGSSFHLLCVCVCVCVLEALFLRFYVIFLDLFPCSKGTQGSEAFWEREYAAFWDLVRLAEYRVLGRNNSFRILKTLPVLASCY